jgi:hypothetical protein
VKRTSISKFDDPGGAFVVEKWTVGLHSIGDKALKEIGNDVAMAASNPVVGVEVE